jgi:hypothetical protein
MHCEARVPSVDFSTRERSASNIVTSRAVGQLVGRRHARLSVVDVRWFADFEARGGP